MKKILFVTFTLIFCLSACKKKIDAGTLPTSNGDPNYDINNRIFRVQASSTAPYTLTIVEYSNENIPYNTQNAQQTGPFDYGFTPIVGHTIKVILVSENGLLTSKILYKGLVLPSVKINTTSNGGSNAYYTYTVND